MVKLREYECRGSGCEQMVRERANILLVGDHVNLFAKNPGHPYGWGTVTQVTEDEVVVERPYVHTSDYTMSGNKLISYLGNETVRLYRHADRVYDISFRTSVPK